jgi:dUTPase
MSSTTNSAEVGGRLMTMLGLQDGINSKINTAWVQAGNPWYRAIWTECAEMMDHVGWKWWKKIQPDVEQIHLELVDIFHFGLSELIVVNGSVNAAQNAAQAAYQSIEAARQDGKTDAAQVLKLIEEFASATLTTKSFAADSFAELCAAVGLGGDSLYRKYVGKNVLNTFRQDHGYKDGSYVKIWSGREDNEWLAEIGTTMQTASDTFPTDLYQALERAYKAHSGAQSK